MNKNLHILLVDDDTRMTRTLADILALAGHQSSQVCSGKGALEQVQRTKFDCVLTDIKMPDMNGVELVDALHQLQPALPIVLMTAYASKELVHHGLQIGAAGVIEKPLDIQLLMEFFSMLKQLPLITIVDDDAAFCQTLSEILRLRGYPVKIISDPHQASDMVTDQAQIVLLDMKLNHTGGYELLQEIHLSYPDLPVLLITCYRQEMAIPILKALEIQARACLYKPLEIEKLLQAIHEIHLAQMRKMLAGK